MKDNGSVEVRITPEPDNPYNNGNDIAQRVDLIGDELGDLGTELDGVDIGYLPLKGHVIALGKSVEDREHYNGTEINFCFRGLPLVGEIVDITGNEGLVYGATVEVWTAYVSPDYEAR